MVTELLSPVIILFLFVKFVLKLYGNVVSYYGKTNYLYKWFQNFEKIVNNRSLKKKVMCKIDYYKYISFNKTALIMVK